ncbi:Outer membrane protein IIIA precursor [Hartmannibacter diazotrophicus]|uniref:Porin n=1 Tax=Hartmannibacter diazotrophicus TaxID=1482074 RepID=A0A2C9D3R1_9HYPH|nr:porin [Hartmannibacter diazotrophicus]SON54900.1 Outer membrane protein IIIA precursor [Hartmannibacter diazotrophicus]
MKLKSILLGTAALAGMTHGALAADAMAEAPVPTAVNYVEVCDAQGAGFFVIPGKETCFKIDGRVRTGFKYDEDGTTNPAGGTADAYTWFADARIGFDARTASDYGPVRSYFRIKVSSSGNVVADQAFVQVGYLLTGYSDSDVLAAAGLDETGEYGNFRDVTFGLPTDDNGGLQFDLLADDLGGGFFAGVQVIDGGAAGTFSQQYNKTAESVAFGGVVGITGQPWGAASLFAMYDDEDDQVSVRATGNFNVMEGLQIAAVIGYMTNNDGNVGYMAQGNVDTVALGLGASYDVTSDVNVYLSGIYGFNDNSTSDSYDILGGAAWTFAEGTSLVGEVSYTDNPGVSGAVGATVGLIRKW